MWRLGAALLTVDGNADGYVLGTRVCDSVELNT
jgi:hypothetical protein